MKSARLQRAAFTIAELLVSMTIAGAVSTMLMYSTWTASHLTARNIGLNRGHEAVRHSNQKLCQDLHGSYSEFALINCTDEQNCIDAPVNITTDLAPGTDAFLSERSEGVRFRRLAAGPLRLAESVTRDSTELTFLYPISGSTAPDDVNSRSYTPKAGDKLFVPLIGRRLDITAVIYNDGTKFTVRTSQKVDFDLKTDIPNAIVTAYFLRRAAYTVYNNQLRYHPEYPGPGIRVRNNVTSPRPFALLFHNGAHSNSFLHLVLESHDLDHSSRRFLAGTSTLRTTITPRVSYAELIKTE